jgi:hypothetical protein
MEPKDYNEMECTSITITIAKIIITNTRYTSPSLDSISDIGSSLDPAEARFSGAEPVLACQISSDIDDRMSHSLQQIEDSSDRESSDRIDAVLVP